MFEVYLNEKHDRLLVIEKGHSIPIIKNSGRWSKKKGAVAVSDEIKMALQRDGFYWRRLAEHRKSSALPKDQLRRLPPVIVKASEQFRGFSRLGRTDSGPNR